MRNSPDGVDWSSPRLTIDAVPRGHQWFPDVASAAGRLSVVFQDTRADPSYSPALPPGNTGGGQNSGNGVLAFVAGSSDGGQTWTWVSNDINAPTFSTPSIGDPCLSAAGLGQNIYVARLP